MSNYTTYKALVKPLSNEKYDISVANKNADTIDSELNKLDLKARGLETALTEETERAANAEAGLRSGLTQEINRAGTAENRLTTDLNAVSSTVNTMGSQMTALTDRIDNLRAEDIGALSSHYGGVIGNPDDLHLHIEGDGITGDTNTIIKGILKIDASEIDAKWVKAIDGEINNLNADTIYVGDETVQAMVQRMIDASVPPEDMIDSNGNLNMQGHNILGTNKIFAQGTNGFEMDFDSLTDFDMGWRGGSTNPTTVDFPIGLHLSKGGVGTAELKVGQSLLKITDHTAELANRLNKTSVFLNGNTLKLSSLGSDNITGDIEISATDDISINSENLSVSGNNHFAGKKFEVTTSDQIIMTAASSFNANGTNVKLTSSNTTNIYSDKAMHIHNRGGKLYMAANSEIYLIPGKTVSADWDSTPQKFPNRVKVFGDLQGIGTPDLGAIDKVWGNIYAQNGTIQTSDRNEKNTINALQTEKSKAFILGLKPVTYKMNSGTSDRTHWGLIAQDVEALLENLGIDSKDFAGFIKAPKAIDSQYDYSLRYDEFIAPMIKVIQDLSRRVEELEKLIPEH